MLQFYNNIQTKETKDKNLLTPCPKTPPALGKLTIVILDAECRDKSMNFTMICESFFLCLSLPIGAVKKASIFNSNTYFGRKVK